MKKHPVDDLFKSKLSPLERKPSSGAWERIEAKSVKKGHRNTPWVWYIAAGVALALGSGYIVWLMQARELQTDVAGVVVPAETQSNVQAKQPENSANTEQREQPEIIQNVKPRIASAPKKENKPADQRTEGKPQIDLIVTDQGELAATQVNEPELPQFSAPERQSLPVPNVVATETSLPAKSLDDNVSRVIVVSVTSVNDTLEKPKASRFARVFKQLKNARAGERVDWDEVGFHPKNVLARVDNKLKL
jgi:hypothetical protein